VIAGDVFIQKGTELISGTVSYIDYADGYFRINGSAGDPDTGLMVRLNDPTGRYSVQQGRGCGAGSDNCTPDARFTGDPDNYTQTYSTGYPLCIPSTEPRDFIDTLDLNGNGNRGETLTAKAAGDGTGDLLCPSSNRGSLTAADSRRLAPLQVDDDVTVQGNYETVGDVRFLSAWSTVIGRALTTSGGTDQPDYMMLNEMSMDAPGFDLNRARALFIGAATAASPDVVIWSLQRDPDTNDGHEFPLASVRGCDVAGGAAGGGGGRRGGGGGACSNALGTHTFVVRHDVDFRTGATGNLSPCNQLRNDFRFTSKNICPSGGTIAENFAILSPLPREVQARTGRKIEDLARSGGPILKTIDVKGDDAPNGQYLFPMGVGLGGIEIPLAAEFNIDALGLPTIFDGLPWALDRRLSPNGCDGACESSPQPLDPFPFSGRDPRTQAPNIPTGAYNDPNYTASQISNVRERILSFVMPRMDRFDGDHSILGALGPQPAARSIQATPSLGGGGDTSGPSQPSGLQAAGVTTGQIDLKWTASTDNVDVTHYLIFRDDSQNPDAIVGGTATKFSDTHLTAGSTHTYTVQAIDAAGNTSAKAASASASASGPKIKLSPANLTFDARQVDSTSAVQTVTVENSGDADLSISGASIAGGDSGDFAHGADTCTGTKLAPGSRCTVDVTFAPHTAGAKNARLAITSSGPDSPDAAPLNGSATAAPAPRTAPVTTTSPAATRPDEPVAPARTKPAARGGSTLELDALRISKHINLRAARRKGLSVAAFVPEGTRVVKIRLTSKGRVIARTVTKVGADNVVTIALPTSPKGRRNLKRGTYTIEVTPGPRAGDYGVTTRRTIRIV
jgi:hypothetical protein